MSPTTFVKMPQRLLELGEVSGAIKLSGVPFVGNLFMLPSHRRRRVRTEVRCGGRRAAMLISGK